MNNNLAPDKVQPDLLRDLAAIKEAQARAETLGRQRLSRQLLSLCRQVEAELGKVQ